MADSQQVVIAAAGRPFPEETVSGDAWHVDWSVDTCRLAVIDGLGHGPEAAAAAEAARASLRANANLTPVDALRACHVALHGTRGAAMWVGTLDLTASQIEYAGVGNVEARLWQAARQERLVGQRGIVGAVLPNVRAFRSTLGHDWTLVVHTDGIREKFDLSEIPACIRGDAQGLADLLLASWARDADDALAVAVRPLASRQCNTRLSKFVSQPLLLRTTSEAQPPVQPVTSVPCCPADRLICTVG